ncbi:MAG: hypothetical protein JWM41_1760 [Gemmatimonadetes bacterium]|nr:hypothetical protein [Gemmatimonadota bacterium]
MSPLPTTYLTKYRAIPSADQFRRDTGRSARGAEGGLLRHIDSQLDAIKPGMADAVLEPVSRLYYSAENWMRANGPRGAEASRYAVVDGVFRVAVSTLCDIFGLDAPDKLKEQLERWYGEQFGVVVCASAAAGDAENPNWLLPEEEVLKRRLVFKSGLIYMWNWDEQHVVRMHPRRAPAAPAAAAARAPAPPAAAPHVVTMHRRPAAGSPRLPSPKLAQPVSADVLVKRETMLQRVARYKLKLADSANAASLGAGVAGYVIRVDHEVFMARHGEAKFGDAKFAHSAYTNGRPVLCAGEIGITNGKLLTVTVASGHYRPGLRSMMEMLNMLSRRGVDLQDVIAGVIIKDPNPLSMTPVDMSYDALDLVRRGGNIDGLAVTTRRRKIYGAVRGWVEGNNKSNRSLDDFWAEDARAEARKAETLAVPPEQRVSEVKRDAQRILTNPGAGDTLIRNARAVEAFADVSADARAEARIVAADPTIVPKMNAAAAKTSELADAVLALMRRGDAYDSPELAAAIRYLLASRRMFDMHKNHRSARAERADASTKLSLAEAAYVAAKRSAAVEVQLETHRRAMSLTALRNGGLLGATEGAIIR